MDEQVTPHPATQPLAFLLGTWSGEGRGHYPTIAEFEYREEVRFWHTGRPWLGYLQQTWSRDGATAMHSETGYWRPLRDGRLEVVLSHAFGLAEVAEGSLEGQRIELVSTALTRTSTAKEVRGVRREVQVEGDVLSYRLSMELADHPLQDHLAAVLRRSR